MDIKPVQMHVNLTAEQHIEDYHRVCQATGISSNAELVRFLLRQFAQDLDRQEIWATMLEAARARREGKITDDEFDEVIGQAS